MKFCDKNQFCAKWCDCTLIIFVSLSHCRHHLIKNLINNISVLTSTLNVALVKRSRIDTRKAMLFFYLLNRMKNNMTKYHNAAKSQCDNTTTLVVICVTFTQILHVNPYNYVTSSLASSKVCANAKSSTSR